MTLSEFLLATLFIASPADKLNTDKIPGFSDYLSPRIALVAREMELLDPRETDHFKKPAKFAADLRMIQARFQNLQLATRLRELERYPDLALINQSIQTNRAYRDTLFNRTDLSAQKVALINAEVDRLYRIYDHLRDSRCEYFYVHYRRAALAKFRDQIGGRAFAAGKMPLPVPGIIWP